MNIIFKNLDGAILVFTPTQEALDLFTLDEIAQRVVPTGLKYLIVDPSAIPSDQTFRDTWELYENEIGEPNGYVCLS